MTPETRTLEAEPQQRSTLSLTRGRLVVLTAAVSVAVAGVVRHATQVPETEEQKTARIIKERDEYLAQRIDEAFPRILQKLSPEDRQRVTPEVERFAKLSAHEGLRFSLPQMPRMSMQYPELLDVPEKLQQWQKNRAKFVYDIETCLRYRLDIGLDNMNALPEILESDGTEGEQPMGLGVTEQKIYSPVIARWRK